MKPAHLVERLLEASEPGAHLTLAELQEIFDKDFNGELASYSEYVGLSDGGKSHRYLTVYDNSDAGGEGEEFGVGDVYVDNERGDLRLDFGGGGPLAAFPTEEEAIAYVQKEAHMKGGGKTKPVPKKRSLSKLPSTAPYHNPYARGRPAGRDDNPHWDGNRYAL